MYNHIIDWDEYPKEKELIPDFLRQEFGKYFLGEYIRSHLSTEHLIGLNDFLKTLSEQELNIFLKLKGKGGRDYINGNTFIEIMIHCLERTGSTAKRPILFAILYIIQRHPKSREIVYNNYQLFEKYANSDNTNIKVISSGILLDLNKEFKLPSKNQYFFKPNSQYEFHKEFKRIISPVNDRIWFWDNYADGEIIEYISSFVDLNKLKEIRVICSDKPGALKYTSALKLEIRKFQNQYSGITIQAKISKASHDRFVIVDDLKWTLGPSLKDAGNTACTINQLKDKSGDDLLDFYKNEWNKSTTL